jgi:iron-sulfur cluster assembly protein
MITVTKAALPQLRRILGNNQYILFGAKGGGCNGFEYMLTPKNTRNVQDHRIEDIGVPITVCGRSGFLVVGTEIDWSEDIMGKRFIFTNPSSTGSCGCGATFSFNTVVA